ncbi:MAG: aldo/keto reductase [Verrucomicrobiota bacterium]
MPLRQIDIPGLRASLTNVMACPSSAAPDWHQAGLDHFHQLGGNCIHLHGEGGETHSRRGVGQWLKRWGLREQFFLCSQIGHEGWDPIARRAVNRCTPEAIAEDISTDLALLGTDYLDLVYIANPPGPALPAVLEAVVGEIDYGRIRAFGVRNWPAEDIRAAQAHAESLGAAGIRAIVTTELALPSARSPLWPQDIPFRLLEEVVRDLGLAVFAHADDFNIGEYLFEESTAAVHPRWKQRWEQPANRLLAERVRQLSVRNGHAPQVINLAWLTNRPFPVVALLSLPDLLSARGATVESASCLVLSEADDKTLRCP